MENSLKNMHGQSRNLVIPSEEKRVENYFFRFKPHYKTFEPKELKLRRFVEEKSEKNLKRIRI